jgi:hypothetical protein
MIVVRYLYKPIINKFMDEQENTSVEAPEEVAPEATEEAAPEAV